jgi:hypothetical protein
MLCFALAAVCLTAAQLQGQQPATPSYYQTLAYIKAAPGKGNEYIQFVRDTTMKAAQVRANAGEIVSWTLLRSVYPAGQEARADYMVSVITEGPPHAERTDLENNLKKAGVKLSVDEFYAKRNSLSSLVATEMWMPRSRVAAPHKGHYLFINFMKVHDFTAYVEFENSVWRPIAEEWVKQGKMSGWIFSTKVLPSGTDTTYSAYSADMFPSWEAAFASRSAQDVFAKVHAGKNYQDTMSPMSKLRSLARREMWVVVERVEKKR